MERVSDNRPNVMCFSGLDPSGGAGIQADIEALFSTGCHCLPIITTLTVQDTLNVVASHPVDPTILVAQARAVLEDIPVQAFKIGLIDSVKGIEVVHTLLRDYPKIPVIFDPILRAGGGYEFSEDDLIEAFNTLLLPLITVLTPNTNEIRALAPRADSLDACAAEILDRGCQHVLLTGTHADSEHVINRLYTAHLPIRSFEWPRLSHEYHGSGCTLAACLAGYMAHGLDINEAVQQAQRFTWESLNHGIRAGFGQFLPNRSYWNR